MRKAFMCSLCHRGILGGGLYLDEQTVTFVCQKLTVDKKYKKLVLPRNEIAEIQWQWIVFPVATFHMKNGEKYRLMIFNKGRFQKYYSQFSETAGY